MIITEQKEIRYIPDSGKNKEQKDEEQVVVRLRLPTAIERSEFRNITYKDMERGVATSFSVDKDAKRIVEACVLTIENLRVQQEGGTVREIRTGAELLSLRNTFAAALVEELLTMLLLADEIPEAEEKK